MILLSKHSIDNFLLGDGLSTSPSFVFKHYDAAGNRDSMTMGSTTTNYTYNALDQLTSAGAITYHYDGRGNLN